MRKILLLILAISFGLVYGQSGEKSSFKILNRNGQEIIVKMKLGDYQLKAIKHGDDLSHLPVIDGGAKHLEKGAPDLQHLTRSLWLEKENVSVEVLRKKEKILTDISILPSKGNLYRDQDPSSVKYIYGPEYNRNEYFPKKIARFGDQYQLRKFKGIPFRLTPMQYNPVEKKLKLYTEITFRIKFSGATNSFPAKVNRSFSEIYKQQFLNYNRGKYKPLDEEGEMLIFTHASFEQEIKQFADWKNKIGIPAQLIRIDTLGNGSAQDIKNYIRNYYQSHDLAYVLLVGDANYVPTHSVSSGDSDHEYGYLSGNDSYPEVFVGRFSAETSAHVQTMVQRTIAYETGLTNLNNWLKTNLGIASQQGPGDDNEMDYEHIRNMQNDLTSYTYSSSMEMFDGTQGGNDAAGDPSASMVQQAVDNGLGNILYTGHGSSSSWGSSGFSNNEIAQLSNFNNWPFIWSVACVNGDFVGNTCFAESWLRAEKNGNPTGAIATLMSTINQSWDPPMHAQDEMVDILVESYAKNIKRTFGGLSMNGCMAMNDAYGSQGEEMTDTWAIFGDPSFMVRTDSSKQISLNTNPTVFVGDSTINLGISVNDARVALSHNGKLLDVDYVQNGNAGLKFQAFNAPDTLSLAIVAYNHDILFTDVVVMPGNKPFVSFKKKMIDDSMGDSDNLADQAEKFMLDVMLENVGLDTAWGVSATLSTKDTAVTILQDSSSWGQIMAKDSSLINQAYEISVKPGVKHGHSVKFQLQISDSAGNSWTSDFQIKIQAPKPQAVSLVVLDDSLGNGDGRLNAGEKALIQIKLENKGKSMLNNAWCTLFSSSTYLDVLKPYESVQNLSEGQSQILVYDVKVIDSIPNGTSIRFDVDIKGGLYYALNSFYEVVGNISEDFESKNFSRYSWAAGGDAGWQIDTNEYFAGNASATSGLQYDQHNSVSSLIISLNILKDDTISFYRKIASEDGYDYLKFYIDNQLQDQWSDYLPWKLVKYPVTKGTHTFKWSYEKDQYVSSYEDKAWIDDVKFPLISTPSSIDRNASIHSLSVYPNPAGESQTLVVKTGKSSYVNVELMDIGGRKVRDIHQGDLGAGTHHLSYRMDDLNAGLYFLKVIVNDNQHLLKIIHH